MAELAKSAIAAEVAHAVIRKFFVELHKEVTEESVQMELYSSGLIDQSTLSLAESERGKRILFDLQEKISRTMDDSVILHTLCQILKKHKKDSLVQEILLAYEKELEAKQIANKAQSAGRNEFNCLKRQLEAFKLTSQISNPPEGLTTVIERTLQNYVETSLEAGVDSQILKEHLSELGSLITSDMLAWVLQELDRIVKQQSPPEISDAVVKEIVSLSDDGPAPLTPSILYHASLVSHAVISCGNTHLLHEFLNKQEKHQLSEASLSLAVPNDDLDRYLIARDGSVIYVAFRSKTSLRNWQSRYKSFEQGLKDQATKIPLRFFIEQLLKRNKIVFTGFSYGGMLASCVTSYLWRAGFLLSTDLLQKNVMCVTFGQPLISIPYVMSTIQKFPSLENTIHLILNKQDKVPSILHYYQMGCILEGQGTLEATSTIETTDFQSPFGMEFVQAFYLFQEKAFKPSYSNAVQSSPSKINPVEVLTRKILALAKDGASEVTHPEMLFGKIYLIKSEGEKIVWMDEITKEVAFKELLRGILVEDIIQEKSFKFHTIEDYQQKVPLIKECSSSLPSKTIARVQEVSFLKPKATTVEFHMYPNEHVIVLEGKNLWFCHKVCIGRHENSIVIDSPSNIMRKSIQFNFKPSDKTEKLCENGGVHVTVFSHFAAEISKRLRAKKEPHFFSLRQIQLAKHTPTEIIQLAYCTAMLEHPVNSTTTTHQPLASKRYEVVKKFLEEAGKIVPLESVFHVIAHETKDTALLCGKALQASGLNFPPSYMMLVCCFEAAGRISTGLTLEEYLHSNNMTVQGGVEISLPSAVIPSPNSNHSSPLLSSASSGEPPSKRSSDSSSIDRQQQLQTSQVKSKLYSEVAEKFQVPPGLPSMDTLNLLFPRLQVSHSEIPERMHRMSTLMPPIATIRSSLQIGALPQMSTLDSELAAYLKRVFIEIEAKARWRGDQLPLICSRSIEHFCPFSLSRTVPGATLQSPIQALIDARRQLTMFSEAAHQKETPTRSTQEQSSLHVNEEMTQLLKHIQEYSLSMCSALLAAFMEQQIRIPLIKSHIDTAKVLSSARTPVAMGSWAFISMDLEDIRNILSSLENSPLIVEIGDYITSVIEQAKKTSGTGNGVTESLPSDINYAHKLFFLVNGIKRGKTVTCSTQFISYSLERQLYELSKQLKFDKTLSVKRLESDWDSAFKNNALSLVAPTHRPLLARWLKWALLIHDLRETLAEYTCVGTIGLSNSGKSHLVNTLFNCQANVGTTEKKRTVVPFLYNMDGHVDKLDVIDFPGVDDVNTVQEVTKLLVNLAQIVIFVVDYRSIGSKISVEWIKQLGNEDVHVLVCLTHADILYSEVKKDLQQLDSIESLTHRIKQELAQTEEKVGCHPSRTMKYFCFDLPSCDGSLTFEELRQVGIYSPKDVGHWLVETFNHKLGQQDLSERLRTYLNGRLMA